MLAVWWQHGGSMAVEWQYYSDCMVVIWWQYGGSTAVVWRQYGGSCWQYGCSMAMAVVKCHGSIAVL